MFFLGSAYPLGKFGLNASINPIMFGALRMVIVFLCLIPFCKIKIPQKKYYLPLLGFSICMGAGVNMFLYLSLEAASILAPITIGAQLSIPLAIILSSMFLGENISFKKWILIFCSFFVILIIFFDPELANNFLGLFYAALMALFFGLAQVYSRQLKELDTSIINVSTGLFGFVILIIVSSVIEGETINSIKLINLESWILIFYQAIIVSLCAHLLMFYLYKFYTVGKIFPFYSLFPIFGISLSFIIFGEVPSFLFLLGGIIVISSVILLHKID